MSLSEKKLTRVIYSLWDIQQSLSALTFLLEDCDFNEKYGYVELRRFRRYETTLIISLARPFENSRNGTTLSLKNIGIKLENSEKDLINKVLHFRRKIIAHSDEEEMHFRSTTIPVLDDEVRFPHIQFNEGLHFDKKELEMLELLLRKLKHGIADFLFELAQNNPDILEAYMLPDSLKQDPTKVLNLTFNI